MEKVDLTLLVHRAMSDPTFQQQLLVDPEAAVNAAGWDLAPDDLAALKAWHANLRDVTKLEELKHSLEDFLASRVPKTCD